MYGMDKKMKKRLAAIEKELLAVAKQEAKLERAAMKERSGGMRETLGNMLPEKVYTGLESAFCKGFALVFSKGRGLIEKTYNKETMQQDHTIRDFAVQVKGNRRELRKMHKSAGKSDFVNLAVTTAEGIGLGALGVGMPDIVLFLSTLLKGIYETALNYGFDYEDPREQLLILKMMAAALLHGEEWLDADGEVNAILNVPDGYVEEEEFQEQLEKTASVFSMDMLVLKFIQGLPLVGIIGGAANPVYYRKVLHYVQLKYRKRYLRNLQTMPVSED